MFETLAVRSPAWMKREMRAWRDAPVSAILLVGLSVYGTHLFYTERHAVMEQRLALAESSPSARENPRTIEPPARAAIIEWLRTGPHEVPVVVSYLGGSVVEPSVFAETLASLLRDAGWTVASVDGGPTLGPAPVGLSVHVAASGDEDDQALGLQLALNQGGFDVSLEETTSQPVGEIRLIVGLAP